MQPWEIFWKNNLQTLTPTDVLLRERIILFIEALLIISLLLVTGQTRRDFFLIKGNPSLLASGVSFPGSRNMLSWKFFATIMTVILATLFTIFMSTLIHPSLIAFIHILPLLPTILAAALLNSFSEELIYRAAPLSQLLKAVDKNQALFLTSIFFGFGHYYGGIPSGPFGFVQTGLLAFFLGKAMIETKGFVLPL